MSREHNILIYTERYEVLLASGTIDDYLGRYRRANAEDRFRVYCCQKVWSSIRLQYTDRALHFATAILTTCDDNLRLSDPVMAEAFREFKTHPNGLRPSHRLGHWPRTGSGGISYLGLPCTGCGEILTVARWKKCHKCGHRKKPI